MFKFIPVAYIFMNFWIVWWFWRMLRGSRWVRPVVCLLFIGWAASFPLLYRNGDASVLQVWLLRIGGFWLAAFIYLFVAVFILDIVGLCRKIWGKKPAGYIPHRPVRPRYKTSLSVVTLVAVIVAASWWNAVSPQLREINLTVEVADPAALGLKNNTLTIAAVSDIHLGRSISAHRLERMLSLLKPYTLDAVFFVGDLIDDPLILDTDILRSSITALDVRSGVWAVMGNHEYVWDINTSIQIMEDSGIRVLRDQWAVLDDAILVVGRDDFSKQRFIGEPRADLEDILSTIPSQYRALPLILLDHQPHHLETAQKAGAILQLSGHTHNGQIFPFNFIGALLYENQFGLSQRGLTHYYVSAGAGTWGPPVRNTARPEVVLVRIQFVSSPSSAR